LGSADVLGLPALIFLNKAVILRLVSGRMNSSLATL
jgi:hypothetical protein